MKDQHYYYEIYTDLGKIDIQASPTFSYYASKKEVEDFTKVLVRNELGFEVFTNEMNNGYKLIQVRISDILKQDIYHELSDVTKELEGVVYH